MAVLALLLAIAPAAANATPGSAPIVPSAAPICVRWESLVPFGSGPGARADHSAIYDAPRDRMIVFGGRDSSQNAVGGVWILSLSDSVWGSLDPGGASPSARFGHAAIFDPVRDRMIVFGGVDLAARNDVWALSLTGTPAWSELHPSGPAPSPRSFCSAVYDPVRDRMLIYGGVNGSGVSNNETWALSLTGDGEWIPLVLAGIGPPESYGQTGVYDPVRDRMLVIGGWSTYQSVLLNETWALSLGDPVVWTQLNPAGTPPPPEAFSSAVYDPAGDVIHLFGGTALDPGLYVLDLSAGGSWSLVGSQGTPRSRREHTAVMDPGRDRMVVFGGLDNVTNATTKAVLTMEGVASVTALGTLAVTPIGSGSIQADPGGSCYAIGTNVTLTAVPNVGYGFTSWSGDVSGNQNPISFPVTHPGTFVANFTGYIISTHSLPASAGHVDRVPHQDTYAPGDSVTLIANPSPGYGFDHWSGDTTGTQNPLIVIAHQRVSITANFIGYTVSVSANQPELGMVTIEPARATYAPGESLVVRALPFPGNTFTGWGGDAGGATNPLTLIVSRNSAVVANFAPVLPACGSWSTVDSTGAPAPRRAASSVYDPVRRRVIVFGGANEHNGTATFFNDVLALSLTTHAWSRIEPLGTPPAPRDGACVAYDFARDRILVFGGNIGGNAGAFVSDVWSLSLGDVPEWLQIVPGSSPPSPRFVPSMIYDEPRDRLLVFGGYVSATNLATDELWELGLSGPETEWHRDSIPNPPPARYGHSAVYDAARGRMLIFGGYKSPSGTGFFNDLWSLDLSPVPTWEQLVPNGAPPAGRTLTSASFDAARDRVLLFGGGTGAGTSNEIWALSLAHDPAWVDLTPYFGPGSPRRFAHCATYDPVGDELIVFGGWNEVVGDLNDALRLGLHEGFALDVVADSPEHGSVTRDPNQGCYPDGGIATLTAVPERGYAFAGWQGDADGNANPLALTMDRYRSVVARFEAVNTATLLAQFDATVLDQGIELRWQFGDPARVTGTRIERAEKDAGPWTALALAIAQETGASVAVDRTADPARVYYYRLVVTLREGGATTFGPIASDARARITLSEISQLGPNPSPGPVQIRFAVARAGVVRMTVVDVAGRVVSTLVDGPQKPGRYTVLWDGHGGAGHVPPGLYFIRLATPDRTVARRLAIVR